jgi:predicted enzyme related to lactoylglutathione lyase
VSLLVQDVKAAEQFYGTLFGWEFRPRPNTHLGGRYVQGLLDGREVAGIGEFPTGRHTPVNWTPYLASDDVDMTAERVRHRGGTVGVGPLSSSSAGRLALVSDPAGAVFGIWQAHADEGLEVLGVPGAPAWIELLTYDASWVAKFYQDVFGHAPRANVSAGPDTLTLHIGPDPVASIRSMGSALPHGRGAHWMTYFETVDVDATARRAVELGGTVVEPPHDGAYGRVATVADPEGALFTLVRTPR